MGMYKSLVPWVNHGRRVTYKAHDGYYSRSYIGERISHTDYIAQIEGVTQRGMNLIIVPLQFQLHYMQKLT